MLKICKTHGETPHVKEKSGYLRCKKCRVDHVKNKRYRMRAESILFKGGKCEICGYSKCSAALEFHHRDPSKKDFQINKAAGKSWIKVLEELEKCDLLCANCHREVHDSLLI